jgi:hypothetical protein
MSTDTIALFDITAEDAMAERLLAVLTADSTFAAPLIDRYRSHWRVPAWTLDSMLPSGDSMLWGPGGFALRLYHLCCRSGKCTPDSISPSRPLCYTLLYPWLGSC